MALPEVYLSGYYENQVTSNPLEGFINIVPNADHLVDATDDVVLSQGGSIALVEGAFRIALPEGQSYTAKVILAGNPRQELEPVTFTLLQSEATEEIVDDGAGGFITTYEKDITDFYTP